MSEPLNCCDDCDACPVIDECAGDPRLATPREWEPGLQDTARHWLEMCEDMVLLRPVRTTKTPAGLDLPPGSKEPFPCQQVVAVGPCVDGVVPGDFVTMQSDKDVSEIEINNESFAMCPADNIIAIHHNLDMSCRKVGVTKTERDEIVEAALIAAKIAQTSGAQQSGLRLSSFKRKAH